MFIFWSSGSWYNLAHIHRFMYLVAGLLMEGLNGAAFVAVGPQAGTHAMLAKRMHGGQVYACA
jgi:hypothetical protein